MEAKISHSGLLARSPEGHAARGMQIKGNEDLWVEIQANTFRNWVNEHLPADQRVTDLSTDLCTGVRLCLLVESLQGRPMRPSYSKRPMNQHQYLENCTAALNAIEKDGVKLVNIGNVDIVNGNLKLILGLIWSLIVRYQIGRSKFPPRKLMLAWLQAVLPECEVHNLTTDFNSGINLAALVDYCQPGLFSHWRSLDKHNSIENCRRAMSVAQTELGIPAVLEPEYLASPWLDELSGMTYLSYFLKPNSPGFHATLRWVNTRLKNKIKNFTTDWNDGKVVNEIVRSLGGNAPNPDTLRTDPNYWEDNLRKGMEAGEKLGVRPILSAHDMADRNVEHLGVMAYAAQYQWVPERPPMHNLIKVRLDSTSARIGEPMTFAVELLETNLSYKLLKTEIKSPDNRAQLCHHNGRGVASYTPQKLGMHEILIYYDNELIPTSYHFRVMPPLVDVPPPGIAPCALGSLVQVLVNATGAPKKEDILVTAYSPHGRPLKCPLQQIDGQNSATFKPDEVGEWKIEITYQGKQIQGGPFTCQVFDTKGVHVSGFEGAIPLMPHELEVDTSSAGVIGDVHADVVHDKRSVHVRIERVNNHTYKLHFTPKHNGKHRVYVYFNGHDVKGSPFMMKVGTQRGRKSANHSPNSSSKLYTSSNSPSPQNTYSLRHSLNQSPVSNYVTTKYHSTNNNSPSPILFESTKPSTKYTSTFSTDVTRTSPIRSSPTRSPNTNMYFETRDVVDRGVTQSPIQNSRSPTTNLYFDNQSPDYYKKTETINKSETRRYDSSPISFNKTEIRRYESSDSPIKTETRRYESSDSPIKTEIRRFESSSPIGGKSETYRFDSSPTAFTTRTETRRYESSGSPLPEKLDSPISPSYTNKLSSLRMRDTKSPTEFDISKNTSSYSSRIIDQEIKEKQFKTSEISQNRTTFLNQLRSDIQNESRPINYVTRNDSRDTIEKTKYTSKSFETSPDTTPSNDYMTAGSKKLAQEVLRNATTKYMTTNDVILTGARAVKVQTVPDGVVGQPVEFDIDGSGAGSGDLEILVEGGRVTSSVRSLGGQRFRAAFTPHQAIPHRVDIRFNDQTVPGSPWNVNIMTPPSLSVMGDSTRLVPANSPAIFEIITTNSNIISDELTVNVLSPSKRIVSARVLPGLSSGVHSVEFLPTEVGTHIVEVAIGGEKLAAGPLIAKVYNAELIEIADVSTGIVGQPVQFRVDASQAGEGQLEISINEGEVPNHVQVVGGGRCLVSFTPDQAKPHLIDIKFNGETVRGCPFICNVTDTSRVTLNLNNLELIPVNQTSNFHIGVGGGGAAELAVAVRGPLGELPVKVTGDIHSGFTAEFTPHQVGAHQITVDYNGRPVQGTPFLAKAFDASRVNVGAVSRGSVGRPVTFSVDASEAGEGNLEITISARGLNIPTQVHPQGNARFAVSFIPAEACDHIVNVAFNKRAVEGCPLIVSVTSGAGGPSVTLPGPGPVHKPATLLINHSGKLEDIEVNVEGPGGQAVPTQVQSLGNGSGFRAEFVPRVVGEHRVAVTVSGTPAPGSPYAAKVYDVNAIKVKETSFGVVGKPVTFLVETSQAGPGNLEVTVNGGRVPTSAQAQGPHTYAISFTPREATPHSVDLRFNGQDVPGSPFTCTIAPAARLVGPDTLDKISVGKPCQFYVESFTAPIVEILGPSRRPVTAKVTPDSEAKFNIEFIPTDVGDHSVEVRIPGGHIEGSPFLVKAYDASRVSVTDITDGAVGKPVSFNINASQAGAGNLEIIVAVNGKNVPNFVQSEGNARFKVNFKPTEAAAHSLSVRFNGQAVPGSPFTCKVTSSNAQHRIPVTGSGLELAALGTPAEIHLEGASSLNPKIIITSPTGTPLRNTVATQGETIVATFTPTAVGRHQISVLVADQHVVGSPYCCNVYDVTKVVVTGLPTKPTAEVGKPITFSVDAAQAGEGTLELVVSTKQGTVKAEVLACARGLYDVTFIPQSCDVHFVNITFNDMAVPGSPFECQVMESMQYVQVGSVAKFELPSSSHRAEIIDSQNRKIIPTKHDKTIEFPVSQIGTYRVMIYDDIEFVANKTIHVFDPSKIEVVSAPEAIRYRPAVVGISLRNTGPGVLSASVKVGNQNVPHSVRQNPSNPKLWEVIFHPENAAPHKIMLLYNNVPKQGVLEVPVRAPGTEPWAGGLGLYQAQVGKVTAFTIDTLGKQAREFDVVVSGPNGSALPVRCYQTRTGKLQAEWTATMSGPHRVEVLHQAKALNGSPFTCQAFVPDRAKVIDPPSQVLPGDTVIFNVNTKESGIAELDVSVTNSIGQSLPVEVTPLDEFIHEVSFVTATTGVYTVNVSYGGLNLPQSPFTVSVGPIPPLPPPRAVGPGLEAAQVGEMASFTVNSSVQPHIKVEAVEGTINAHIKAVKPGEYIVSYIPLWVGTYDIMISCGGQTLAGCPFRPTIVDTTAVRVIGGWQQYLDENGRLKLPCKMALDIANAGPGQIECILSERKINIESNGTRVRLDISAEGLSPGEHDFVLLFGNVHLSDAPRLAATSGDQVILTGRGLAQAQCDEVSTFNIDGSRAGPGTPEVSLKTADTKTPITVNLTPLGNNTWKAQYTVQSSGNYLLSVLWAGRPVRGCPLMIEAKGGADASKVICSGEGLRHGVVGREIRSWIDTRRAGPGELTAHCAGPRKVAYCELYDHGDATFTLNVKPQESGRHALTVKYAGKHVPGSPFLLRVAGAPDASKVRVYGPGIEHGVLATFQSRFICDTRGAGAGQLTVRVRGPKGAFRVEMQRESQKDRTILCKYDPTEPGDYRVEVKWAGELVPGSPFPVMIFDTQEELRRYINSM